MTLTVSTFTLTFSTATFVVPAGVFSLDCHVIGGSGGGSQTLGFPRGLPADMTGTLAVTPGETLFIQVGGAGGTAGTSSSVGTSTAGFPDGGAGGFGPSNNRGGGGGGSTRIWRVGVGGTLVVLCAGGGGIGGRDSAANPRTMDGGVPIGQTTTGLAATGNGGNGNPLPQGGLGATPSAGGTGGTGTLNGTAGASMAGGVGRAGTSLAIRSGGGGGGGLFGGGGGASGTAATTAGGGGSGGGGSSYIDMSQGWTNTLWDNLIVSETSQLQFKAGTVIFSYNIPSGGGWSLGLVSRLG